MNTRDKFGTSSAFVCERKAKPPHRTSSFYLWCNDLILRLHDGKYMTHELSGRVLVGSHRCVGSCGRHGQSAIQAHRRLDGRPGSSRLRAVRLEVDSLHSSDSSASRSIARSAPSYSVPSRAQRPCAPSESMLSTSNRTSRRPTGTAQCATGARQDRHSLWSLTGLTDRAGGGGLGA